MPIRATTSQTVGPFFKIGLDRLNRAEISAGEGPRLKIHGQVFDARGSGVPDAVIEVWQADSEGSYQAVEQSRGLAHHAVLTGFGRVSTEPDGSFSFTTVKPGRVRDPLGGLQAPHLNVSVFCRGLLQRLVTRIYFPEEPSNAEDFALKLVPADRRKTLIAEYEGPAALKWDLVLQGQRETVFFDL